MEVRGLKKRKCWFKDTTTQYIYNGGLEVFMDFLERYCLLQLILWEDQNKVF